MQYKYTASIYTPSVYIYNKLIQYPALIVVVVIYYTTGGLQLHREQKIDLGSHLIGTRCRPGNKRGWQLIRLRLQMSEGIAQQELMKVSMNAPSGAPSGRFYSPVRWARHREICVSIGSLPHPRKRVWLRALCHLIKWLVLDQTLQAVDFVAGGGRMACGQGQGGPNEQNS